MKELMWWPEVEPFFKTNNIYGYFNANDGPILTKYSPNGKFIFSKPLTWDTPNGAKLRLYKSADDKHVFTVYNNDVWVGDFDLKTGSSSNMHQVTQSGQMQLGSSDYMKNDILLLDRYMVNTLDGAFMNYVPHAVIPSDSSVHFSSLSYSGQFNTVLYSFSGWKKTYPAYYATKSGDIIDHALYWLDRKHTKMLWAREMPNRSFSHFIRTYGEDYSPSDAFKNITNVTWKYIYNISSSIFTGSATEPDAISPNSKYHLSRYMFDGETESLLHVYNLEDLSEYSLPVDIDPERAAWADDSHIIVSMQAGSRIAGTGDGSTKVTTDTQGTYFFDLKTKQFKRITPYLIKDSGHIICLLYAKIVLFEANNFLYRCNSDGTDLIQLTKIPDVYKLKGAFMKPK